MTKWISRASVLRIIDAEPVYSDVINEKNYMASQIKDLPTKEETSRPHGEWIIRRNKQGAHIYSVCSKCNMPYLDTDFPNFCPNCGAEMREGDEK